MLQLLKRSTPYFPIIGLIGFSLLFLMATSKYPGGSIHDMAAKQYSYFHNFICDLMSLNLPEGAVNDARPIAVIAHLMLSFAMISFFYILPEIFVRQNANTRFIRGVGMLSMLVFTFMFTDYHDLVVLIFSPLTVLALVPFFIELLKYDHKPLKYLAYTCLCLSILVFLSYVTKIGIYYAPMLQKITFVFDSIWVIWVSVLVATKRRLSVI